MNPIKIIIIVTLINLGTMLGATTDYQSQYNITNQWLQLQENLNNKTTQFRTDTENGDIIQQAVTGVINIVEAILVIPKFVIFLINIILSPISIPFSYANSATNTNEQIIWGIIGWFSVTINIILVFTVYKLIVNKDSW